MTDQIRIVIADDHPLIREGIVHALAAESDLAVVGQADTGEEALRLAIDLVPDIVMLDIGMPGCGGIVTAEQLSQACPVTKVVMLTVYADEDHWLAAFKAGLAVMSSKGCRRAKWPISCGSLPPVRCMFRRRWPPGCCAS